MSGIDYVVECADCMLNLGPAVIVTAKKTREVFSTHADDSQVEVKYSFNSKMCDSVSDFVLIEQGQRMPTDSEIAKRGIDWLIYRLNEKPAIGVITASEVNSMPLEEISKKHGFAPDVKKKVYGYVWRKTPFAEGTAILYRKNTPQ